MVLQGASIRACIGGCVVSGLNYCFHRALRVYPCPLSVAGTMSYAVLIIAINVRLLMCADLFTRWHWLATLFSISIWFLLALVYDAVPPTSSAGASQVTHTPSPPPSPPTGVPKLLWQPRH